MATEGASKQRVTVDAWDGWWAAWRERTGEPRRCGHKDDLVTIVQGRISPRDGNACGAWDACSAGREQAQAPSVRRGLVRLNQVLPQLLSTLG